MHIICLSVGVAVLLVQLLQLGSLDAYSLFKIPMLPNTSNQRLHVVHETVGSLHAARRIDYSYNRRPGSTIHCRGSPTIFRCSNDQVENGIDLSVLDQLEVDGCYLRTSIARWLDEEYIVQPIHAAIGKQVEDIYLRERRSGVTDLGEMLMQVGASLEQFDMGNAFVNAWDVANRVADFLIVRMDRELCECAGDLSGYIDRVPTEVKIPMNSQYMDPDGWTAAAAGTSSVGDELQDKIRATRIRNTVRLLHSEFARLKFLREFLEGDLMWEDVQIVIGVVMGFRLTSDHPVMEQDRDLSLFRWENLASIPDVSNLDDSLLQRKMTADLPEDEEATDLVIETIAGMEAHLVMKASSDPLVQRRVLVAKWLYTQGFLTTDFPALERFVPHHLVEEFEEATGTGRS